MNTNSKLFSALVGQASSANAEASGKLAVLMADIAWDFATKEGFRVFKSESGSLSKNPPKRSYSTWSHSLRPLENRTFVPRAYLHSNQRGILIISPEGLSTKAKNLYSNLKEFIELHIYPAEQELRNYQFSENRWTPHKLIEDLKVKAKNICNGKQ